MRVRSYQFLGLAPVRAFLISSTTLASCASVADAAAPLPVGGTVAAGNAQISAGANSTTITQGSSRAVINWQSFDVAAGKSVVFNQPDAQGATLNRVTGGTTSTIAGNITSNGAVYLVNPNGIAITSTGTVNTQGGFVASTLDIADADFMAGKLNFVGNGASSSVRNAGTIAAGQGAYVALLGGAVSNSGLITVPYGKVGLGSGENIALDLNGGGFMQVAVPSNLLTGSAALIDNAGSITASGGTVQLQAAVVKDAVRNVINMSGSINVDSATGDGGTIHLIGGADTSSMAGSVTVSGSLSARATGAVGNGGFVETSGATVHYGGLKVSAASAHGKAGTWLLDPDDLTVGTIDDQATIEGALFSGTDVTLQTSAAGASGVGETASGNGDITINQSLYWYTPNTLTLDAYHSVTINSSIAIFGAGGLVIKTNDGGTGGSYSLSPTNGQINYGTTDHGGTFTLNGVAYTLVYTMAQLDAIDGVNAVDGTTLTTYGAGLTGNYALATSLNASGTTYTQALIGLGAVNPGPNGNFQFTGTFDGLGNSISGLTITAPSVSYVGLFGSTQNATIRNIAVTDASVLGRSYVGVLGGYVGGGTVTQSTASGTSGGYTSVGGLIGSSSGDISYSSAAVSVTVGAGGGGGGLVGQTSGAITNSFATGTVNGAGPYVGGLVGYTTGAISNSYATGSVTGSADHVGGLAGGADGATIDNSYATGAVTGANNYVGGLVGQTSDAISSSYANGTVNSTGAGNYVGGLVGGSTASISGSSAYGDVSGGAKVGGLVGQTSAAITNSSASGAVTGTGSYVGGLVGATTGTISGSYAQGRVTGVGSVGGLAGGAYGDSITTSHATGSVTGSGTLVGGLVGNASAAISGSYAAGAVSSTGSYVGGLVGNATGPISGSYATGAVSGASYVGGLVGASTGTIDRGFATGSITGVAYLGGLVGRSLGAISNSFATGAVQGSTTSGSSEYAGGLVGWSNTAISNSYATGAVSLYAEVGGLAGFASGSITQSYATGAVVGYFNVGGLVGDDHDPFDVSGKKHGSITQSYATGTVSGGRDVGGLVGSNSDTVDQSYSSGAVSGTSFAGGLLGSSSGTVANSYWDSYSSGQSNAVGNGSSTGISAVTSDPTQSAAANFAYTASAYANFTPSAWVFLSNTRPLLASETPVTVNGITTITTSHQLLFVNQSGAALSASYALGANIDLSNISGVTRAGFTPIGTDGAGNIWDGTAFSAKSGASIGFSGSFDGKGYAVSGLNINLPTSNIVGLFGDVSGSVANLSVAGTVNGGSIVGGVVGRLTGTGQISNVYFSGSVTGTNIVGGVLGSMISGSVTDSYADNFGAPGGVTATGSYAGGLVGVVWAGNVIHSSANVDVSGVNDVGGIVGYLASGATLVSSGGSGTVTATGDNAGGAVGYSEGTLNNVNGYVNVKGTRFVGGLVGAQAAGSIISGYSLSLGGSVNASGDFAGGLVGYQYAGGSITGSSAGASVTGTGNYTGGLVGLSNGSIGTSKATGAVSGTNYVGGLIGWQATGAISKVSASGAVMGTNAVGGLVGYVAGGSLDQGAASGSVNAKGYYIGGLIGLQRGGTVTNVSVTGYVAGTGTYVGGLIGYQDGGSTTTALATGHVGGTTGIGGLVGYAAGGSLTNGVWNTNTGPANAYAFITVSAVISGANGLTYSALQSATGYAATYPGFDFTTIWSPPTGTSYATLRNTP